MTKEDRQERSIFRKKLTALRHKHLRCLRKDYPSTKNLNSFKKDVAEFVTEFPEWEKQKAYNQPF